MIKPAILFAPLAVLMIFISSCRDNTQETPYADLLSQPPYAALTDSIEKDKTNHRLYFRRAVLLNSNDQPEPALADFRKAWSLEKNESYALGISTLLLDRDPDSAILFLQEALQAIPNSYMLQLSLARNYEARQQTDKALLICESLLKQDSLRVDVLKFKAGLLAKKGNNDAAVLTLEKAYQLVPYDVELNYMLALKYAENRDPKALRLCDSLARADSEEVHAEPFYYKGIYYAAVNDKANAIASFNEAISHDYNFLDAYIEKAAVLVDQKKYAEAIKTLELALTISPGFADAYYWLGKSYEAMGNREDAGLNYRKALGLDPMLKEAKEGIERVK